MSPRGTEHPPKCPCCGSPQTELKHRLRAFDVHRCAKCTLLFRHPLPEPESLEEMYEDARYHEGRYFQNSAKAYDLDAPEIRIYSAALAELRRLAPAGRLLDVGCGRGVFLDLARSAGFETSGIELSKRHVDWARSQFELDVVAGEFLDSEHTPASFEIVTMWDFLEHVIDPIAVLNRARELLAPQGLLLVFTIDANSLFNHIADLLASASGGRIARPLELLYDVHHNHYFTRRSLEQLLDNQGFAVAHWASHRAYLGRWLNEPASPALFLGGVVIDRIADVVGLPYRHTAICRRT